MITIAQALNAAQQFLQAGNLQHAERIYQQILQANPSQTTALHWLGVIAHQMGRPDVAVQYMAQLVKLAPDHSGLHYNLGSAWQALAKWDEAANCYREAIRLQPDYADAHNNLGGVLAEQGKLDEAAACYQQALAVNPKCAAAHCNLANHLKQQGKLAEAINCYHQALRLDNNNLPAHLNLGTLLLDQYQREEASAHFQEAIRINPRHVLAHNNFGNALRMLDRLDEAAASYDMALSLRPDFAEAYYNLGHVRLEQRRLDDAVACYQQAIRLKPDMADAHLCLARVLGEQGKVEEESACLEQAVRLQNAARTRITLATRLPVIYQSTAHLEACRARLAQGIRQLHEDGVELDLSEETAVTAFYLAYQGQDDRDIMRDLAALHRAPKTPNVVSRKSNVQENSTLDRRHSTSDVGHIRIGFLSSFFRAHTIGHLMRGLITKLSRKMFEVTVLSAGHHEDDLAGFIKQHADRFLEVPRHLPSARQLIAEQNLDVLFHTDIGMNPFTSTLAYSRLAPVQCTTWGHPVTSGIDTIDYFVSSEHLDRKGAEEHYAERLVKLKTLPIYYYRPELVGPLKERRDFGFPDDAHIYACPQSLFKLHPDFDEVLGAILRGDPHGLVVLSLGLGACWERPLRQRFAVTLPDVVDRVRFVPELKRPDFLNLLALTDVLLDPLHFGGGNTSYEALAFGVPIVTLPSRFLRGRITFALYQQMQLLDCVVLDPKQFIEKALRLGTDRAYREELRGRILAANRVLYENSDGIRDLEQFFQQAVERQRPNARSRILVPEHLSNRVPE
jgi:predicted O-linked N-acetylglucosamine transferase (SPINDLY family)